MLATEFASAERDGIEQVLEQHRTLSALPFVHEFLNAMPHMTVVLNKHRQIVFGNRVFAQFLGFPSGELTGVGADSDAVDQFTSAVLGMRPGEAVGCLHSAETPGGCGTTVHCRRCALVRSILNSQATNAQDIQEGVLERHSDAHPRSETLDLRAWARPVVVGEETYTVFSLVDISDERRRASLERIFFHDVLNTAGGVRGLAEMIAVDEVLPPTALRTATMLLESADQLIEEINGQRALASAEMGDLAVNVEVLQARAQLDHVEHLFSGSSVAFGKRLAIDPMAEDYTFTSDATLLRRVLVNLVKNALEASKGGDTVMISAGQAGDARHCWFSVHNDAAMPDEVKQHIFVRSFSTKGTGRGLGTYSIKLLTESYLRGDVRFTSTAAEGTKFTLTLPRFLI